MAKVEPAGRFVTFAYIIFLACMALGGGSSRFDAASQPIVRLAAIVLIAALVVRPGAVEQRSCRKGLWFLGAISAAILIQLVPLPAPFWTILPGHDHYLAAASAAGEAQPWRPINLTPDRGWNSVFALLPPAAALVATSRIQSRQQTLILAMLILIVLASAVIGLAQVSGGGDDTLRFYAAPPTGSAVGLFSNRNHQAVLLCCGISMLGAWAELGAGGAANGRMRLLIAGAAAAFLVLMIPTTGSRAGLALGALALLTAIGLAAPAGARALRSLSRGRRWLVAVAAAAALAAVIVSALTFSRAESVRRLFDSDPMDDARIRLLRPLLAMTREFFPVGTGFGSFDPVYRGFEPSTNLMLTVMNQAHDDYLQVVLEAGLPGLVLLVAFVGWWGWTSAGLWRRPADRPGAFGRLGSVLLLLLLLASATDYPLRTPLMMVVAAQAAAWMLIASRRRDAVG